MNKIIISSIILGLLVVGLPAAWAINYTYEEVNLPEFIYGDVTGFNDQDEIVGEYSMPDEEDKMISFLWKGGVLTTFSYTENGETSNVTSANDINNSGIIVGHAYSSDGSNLFGFTYDGVNFTKVTSSLAYGLIVQDNNDLGHMAGIFFRDNRTDGFYFDGLTYKILRPTTAGYFQPYLINNKGLIIGDCYDEGYPDNRYICSVQENAWVKLEPPGSTFSYLRGMNNLSDVVGAYRNLQDRTVGFKFDGVSWKTLDYPESWYTEARGINDKRIIVGLYSDHNQVYGFSYVNGIWSTLTYPNATRTAAKFVNNKGIIFGEFTKDEKQGYFLARPITPIEIDIRPYSSYNQIYYKSPLIVPVSILSRKTFKAYDVVDRNSLTFGQTGDESSLLYCGALHPDVNHDGYADLTCYFSISKTGFECGNSSGTLKGKKKDGLPIEGKSYVRIIGCR